MSLRGLLRNRSASFAVNAALMMAGLIVGLGGAVDMGRGYLGRVHLQKAVDSAALAIATSKITDPAELHGLAAMYIAANVHDDSIRDVSVTRATVDDKNRVVVQASGRVDMTFLRMVRQESLVFSLEAQTDRPNVLNIEVALVLDNTFSMSIKDKGVEKLTALKTAASQLVTALMDAETGEGGSVMIGLVPYANNVNVGLHRRNEPWLSVPDNYSVTTQPSPRVCKTLTTKTRCLSKAPDYSCPTFVDGVEKPKTCAGACLISEKYEVAPYESCSGGGNPTTTTYSWYGCVGSRKGATSNLNDGNPTETYPGFVVKDSDWADWSGNCLQPIVDLTDQKSVLLSAIAGMMHSKTNPNNKNQKFEPLTYIPAGLIWGQNMLSPTAPLTKARPYSDENENPRKIMILMTDGENTLKRSPSTGKHTSGSASDLAKTDSETAALCAYAKSKKIEIYTVALMVEDAGARSLLEGCASNKGNYFDASDTSALVEAFKSIAGSINAVRLVN